MIVLIVGITYPILYKVIIKKDCDEFENLQILKCQDFSQHYVKSFDTMSP
jgi:hypothetical protein